MKTTFDEIKNLKHQSIVLVDDYSVCDGLHANNTDARALSVGLSQWDSKEISAKVLRKPGNVWSRQSEELPLHRCFDLCNLIILAFLKSKGIDFGGELEFNTIQIKTIDIKQIEEFYEQNKHYLLPKMTILKDLLETWIALNSNSGHI